MTEPDPATRLLGMASGFRLAQAVHVAAVLDLAGLLAGGPRAPRDLARACAVDQAALTRLLKLLAANEVLRRLPDGTYATTELGACLHPDAPGDTRAWVLMFGAAQYRAWGALLHTVRTGRPAFPEVHGVDFWTYLAGHPDQEATFTAAMRESAVDVGALLLAHRDLSGYAHVVDVGGGSGAVLATLLRAYPDLRATLVDQAGALAGAAGTLGGFRDRCALVPGDFFLDVPPGADLYLLCRVLGDWPDDRATAILAACRRAMRPDSTLIVLGGLSDDAPPAWRAALDLHLSVLMGGGDRSLDEYTALLAGAGLHARRGTPTGTGTVLIDAVRADAPGAGPAAT